jgi:hypothetical protein
MIDPAAGSSEVDQSAVAATDACPFEATDAEESTLHHLAGEDFVARRGSRQRPVAVRCGGSRVALPTEKAVHKNIPQRRTRSEDPSSVNVCPGAQA